MSADFKGMADVLFPKRQRCKTCRKAFEKTVLDGLFCSYQCANILAPKANIDLAPRNCKRMTGASWGWKTKYTHEGAVPQRLQDDPGTNIYRCDYCHFLHVGHSRPVEIGFERLSRVIHDEKVLGSVIKRFRESKKIDIKVLAKILKVPVIRLNEIEEGKPNPDVSVIFKVLNYLRLNFTLTER